MSGLLPYLVQYPFHWPYAPESLVFLFQTRTSACWPWGQRSTLASRLQRDVYHALRWCRCTWLHHPCSTWHHPTHSKRTPWSTEIFQAQRKCQRADAWNKSAQMVSEMLWVWPSFHLKESAEKQRLHQALKRSLLQPACVWYHQQLFAPASLCVISSTVGNVYCSLFIALFKCFRSTHMRTSPFFFKTGTTGEHQSVGSVISLTTPSDNIHCSSCSTLCESGMGILLATCMLYGSASSSRTTMIGSQSTGLPTAPNAISFISSKRLTSPRESAALLLSRQSVFPATTKIRNHVRFLFQNVVAINWPTLLTGPLGLSSFALLCLSLGLGDIFSTLFLRWQKRLLLCQF